MLEVPADRVDIALQRLRPIMVRRAAQEVPLFKPNGPFPSPTLLAEFTGVRVEVVVEEGAQVFPACPVR